MSMSDENAPQGQSTVDQVREAGAQAAENAKAFGSHMRDVASEKMSDLREQAHEYYERGKQRAQDFEQDVTDYVRAKPIQSLLVAAGVGLVLGVLFRRH